MVNPVHAFSRSGAAAALAAALLFGASAPLAKLLLHTISPWLMAGLLYLGAGLGLLVYRTLRRAPAVRLQRGEGTWLAAAVLCGGVLGPVLLMLGLAHMPAVSASLLLNAEGVFTALLAWFVFRENFDRRIALGMGLIVAGALVLAWPGASDGLAPGLPLLAVLGACLAWALDNNFTRKLALQDATWIATVKGLCAGSANLALALLAESLGWIAPSPALATLGRALPLALLLGLLSYGVSLSLFVYALRQLGTARTGAYFSAAPFFGAALAVALGEPVTVPLLLAGALMAAGVWLHLTERHSHTHNHAVTSHGHPHQHDEHHQHSHDFAWDGREPHSHDHQHAPLQHRHPHYPDAHHRHGHGA
jgi:drug/metabolite transporter (DMT)-like permease